MPRSHRNIYLNSPAADPNSPVRLWLLRILVPMGGQRLFVERNGFRNDTLAAMLGLSHWIDSPDDFDPSPVRAELRRLHAQAEKAGRRVKLPETLVRNTERIAGMMNLGEADKRILQFAAFIHSDRLLDDTADWLGMVSTSRLFEVLAALLDLSAAEVRTALAATGPLARTGLLTIDRRGSDTLKCKLSLLADSVADLLLSGDENFLTALFRDVVTPSPAPTLTLDDFSHLERSLEILRPYLDHSMKVGRLGVNIFVHGLPGTGKTQFARALSQSLGREMVEISSEDDNGDPQSGDRRLRAFRFAQSCYANKRYLILFDEVEDVFDDGDKLFGRKSLAQVRKGWINRTLEENPVPTFWLSNSVDCLDPAFVRRFDMVIEMPVPPRLQRRRILEESCGALLGPESLDRLAACDYLAPAVVTRAAAVVKCIAENLPPERRTSAVEYLVGNVLVAQGNAPLARELSAMPGAYDPALINTGADLVAVAEGIDRARSARLCLYGPPGTGKSAYAHWLAERLDRPLHVRRGSDLLGMYVGETEKRIARAFRSAEQEGALLLLDEVDGFLQDRRDAHRSWEVTAVNEMLTQMEGFGGVLVATTNLVADLDQAALRRFDLKLQFDFLKPEQAWLLFQRQCAASNLPQPSGEIRARLARLEMLTPGDFAAVARRQRFDPATGPEQLSEAIEAEYLAKEGAGARSIGFV